MMTRNRFFLPRKDKILGNRYQLLECFGDGSYGWVWRAEKLDTHEIVAVKIPKEQGAANEMLVEGRTLVEKEARHPNVVSVFWMDRVPPEKEWYVIEMEYFPSVTLAQLLDEGAQGFIASYARILDIYQQVLRGVEYLHGLGMSHGDIKPQNILVSGDRVKITDFGSSVRPDEMYARTRENGGTILYSAPEVVGSSRRGKSRQAIFAADVYSLGVLLYHLVTSQLPHDTLSQVSRHSPFPRPREINSSVCPALEEVVLRCLALEPGDRYPSVTELVHTVERASKAQIDYVPERTLSARKELSVDWSSHFVHLIDDGDYTKAEHVARTEFERSGDPHAFLLMVSAADRDGRFFDCKRDFCQHPDVLERTSPVQNDLRELALRCFLETREIERAAGLLEKMAATAGETPNVLLKKASVLGLQARYAESRDILLQLNRDFPGRSAVLKRLVTVFEQLRDPGKAAAFLKAYQKSAPGDPWAVQKKEQLAVLGYQ